MRRCGQSPPLVERRLRELDREWDIERTLETNASALALTGTLLGAFVDRRFLVIPAVVTGFLLQHAVQGWCPPCPSSAGAASGRRLKSIGKGALAARRLRAVSAERGPRRAQEALAAAAA